MYMYNSSTANDLYINNNHNSGEKFKYFFINYAHTCTNYICLLLCNEWLSLQHRYCPGSPWDNSASVIGRPS